MTENQQLVLQRLQDDFGVDVSEAECLEGQDLDSWIAASETALFEQLHSELRAQRDSGVWGSAPCQRLRRQCLSNGMRCYWHLMHAISLPRGAFFLTWQSAICAP